MERIGLTKWRFGSASSARYFLILMVALFMVGCGYAYQPSVNPGPENTTDDITYLAQYGTWIDIEPFGNVWQPSVSSDWRPFSYGHWVWSDAGWAWVSYEPYGWLVYHYGNWNFEPNTGWFWIEGSDWSPAQVEWLNYDGYSSWAPLPPAGIEWQDPWLEAGRPYWVVVRDRDLGRDNIGHYGIGKPPQPRQMDGKDVFHKALDIQKFEQITGRKITPITLSHGPMPVYMNQKPPIQNQEKQPRVIQHEQKPPEQNPPPNYQAENPQTGPNQPEAQAAKKPQEVGRPIQLHKMILPKKEEAKINKYRPRVERVVLKPKDKGNQPPPNTSEKKNKK